ncbi:hypothetical protein DFQ03_1758 [Maribacter caenipelagi]|uniref:Uncharacterized protein n=1 Tax=Maribacter caenipelagi TaxID=1447781 RepID=A0A4R7D2V5_9FLAO|nr:hypothetical protein DFQ03_1758 [Maribacter caenipelagi]
MGHILELKIQNLDKVLDNAKRHRLLVLTISYELMFLS